MNPTIPRVASRAEWQPAVRVGFRFAYVWFIFICFPYPLMFMPGLKILAAIYGELSVAGTAALAKGLFGPTLSTRETGSTDRAVDWYMLGVSLLLCGLATLIWSIRTREKEHSQCLEGLRTYVRYTLASAMITYAVIKLVKIQFPDPELVWLTETYGESSPHRLLWMFMGYSKTYAFFTGLVELVGALALFFRRTTTLGALLSALALTNVVMINFCYDIPVKLWSTELLLMAVFLLLPDLKRLAHVFVFNRAVEPVPARDPLPPGWKTRARPYVKAVLIGCALIAGAQTASSNQQPPRPALYGYYEVSSFVKNGLTLPSALVEPARWRNLIIGTRDEISIRLMDDTTLRFQIKDDPDKRSLTVTKPREKAALGVLTYAEPARGELSLSGTFQGDLVEARLQKVDRTFPLLERGFHWVSEAPFNR